MSSIDISDFSEVPEELINAIKRLNIELQTRYAKFAVREQELGKREQELDKRKQELGKREQTLNHRDSSFTCRNAKLIANMQQLSETCIKSERVACKLLSKETELNNLVRVLINKEAILDAKEDTIDRKLDNLNDLEYVANYNRREHFLSQPPETYTAELYKLLEKSEVIMTDIQCKIWPLVYLIKEAKRYSDITSENLCSAIRNTNMEITSSIMQLHAELKSAIDTVYDTKEHNDDYLYKTDSAQAIDRLADLYDYDLECPYDLERFHDNYYSEAAEIAVYESTLSFNEAIE